MSEASFDVSRLYTVYLMEAAGLAEDITTGIDRLEAYWLHHKQLHPVAKESMLVVDPKIQKELQTVIADVARLCNLLTYEPRSNNCSYLTVSKERTGYFGNLFKSEELKEIRSRRARNSLEHFEERLDQEIAKQREMRPNSPGVIYGCLLPTRDMLELVGGDRIRIRVFACDEMHFYNFDGDISLLVVREEVKVIRSVLAQQLGSKGYERATGSGLIYPPAAPGALTPTSAGE